MHSSYRSTAHHDLTHAAMAYGHCYHSAQIKKAIRQFNEWLFL